jgi:hypothetical protein
MPPRRRGPSSAVTRAALAGAVTTILVWIAKQFFQIDIPANVASAITVVITAGAAAIGD